jgi:Na+-driven multidrug efflux pump
MMRFTISQLLLLVLLLMLSEGNSFTMTTTKTADLPQSRGSLRLAPTNVAHRGRRIRISDASRSSRLRTKMSSSDSDNSWWLPAQTRISSLRLHAQTRRRSSYSSYISMLGASFSPVTNDSDDGSAVDENNLVELALQQPKTSVVMSFLLSTVGIWLSEPILSLVDTAVVGVGSTTDLAALAPGTMLLDSSLYLLYFLAVAVMSQVATAIANKDIDAKHKAQSNALSVAALLGVLVFLILQVFGRPMVTLISGKDNISIVPAAMRYVAIRSFSAPASIINVVAQAAHLAALDTFTPAMAVLASFVVNVGCDIFFVSYLKLGIAGAALGTSLANVVSCCILLRSLVSSRRSERQTMTAEKSISSSSSSSGTKSFPLFTLPSKEEIRSLIAFAGPMFFVNISKLLCYCQMTLAATRLGISSLAAHNVLLRLYFFFATGGDAFSQLSQCFLPSLLLDKKAVRSFLLRMSTLFASVVGIVAAVGAGIIPRSSKLVQLFTTDVAIQKLMFAVTPTMQLALLVHPLSMLLEGSLIAQKDYMYLLCVYLATILILAYRLKGGVASLNVVWQSLLLMTAIRTGTFFVRNMMKIGENTFVEKKKARAIIE